MPHQNDLMTQLARIAERQDAIREDIGAIRGMVQKLEEKFVTRAEFLPVKSLVYGFAAVILTAFAIGVVALIFNSAGMFP